MPELSGFIARLLLDDQPTDEYEVKMENGTDISCFIASEEGKVFSIEIANESAHELVAFEMFVDGTKIDAFVLETGSWKVRDKVKTSPNIWRALRFSKLTTTEVEPVQPSSASDVTSVGTIKFHVWRIARMKEMGQTSSWERSLPNTPIPETKKSAVSHRISLGPPTPKPRGVRMLVRRLDPERGPVARIVFRYRPKDLLQAQGIVPALPGRPSDIAPQGMKRAASEDPFQDDSDIRKARNNRRRTMPASVEGLPRLSSDSASNSKAQEHRNSGADAEVVLLREQMKHMQDRLDLLESERRIKMEMSSQRTWNGMKLEPQATQSFVKKEGRLTQVRYAMKRERSPIRLPFPSGEIIDLTGD
ncbi:unnamed protein product [Somion occarium]|uniref:DUF7918 domain-containing protein n=1 Tax=Somion occarium TaxID=3059160 RepID=A0ABP1DSN6_9APHY